MSVTAIVERGVAAPPEQSHTRRDIQALRALAVLAVVVYHLWPSALPGGFVGVDVFFVISGFLITSHLIRTPPRRPADFARFWAKRVLRLLPPVVPVILFILAAALLFMSSGQWQRLSVDAVASMFYVENWRLVRDATDYLDANRAVSPFQHFWSLSVEEQYYVVWPVLVGALALASRAAAEATRTRLYLGAFGVVVAASLWYSVTLTATAPDEAYFSTFTRMWELGTGSLLAAAYPALRRTLHGRRVRLGLLWAGVAGIGLSLVLIDGTTPFPGYAALLPTVSAALVILAHDPQHRLNPRWVTHARPVQLLGDVSYALYLWHWPLIILTPYALDRELSATDKVAVLVASLSMAWLSTRFLENPVRSAAVFRRRTGRVLLAGAAASALVLVVSLLIHQQVGQQIEENRAELRARSTSGDGCFGAAAMEPTASCPSEPELATSPEFAKADITRGILDCLNWAPFPDPLVRCSGGDREDPVRRIALFGNSHAGHWVEALNRLGRTNGWQVDTFIIGICKTTDQWPAAGEATDETAAQCPALQAGVIDSITSGGYDAVVMSTMDRDPTSTPELYRSVLDRFTAAGQEVVVIRDTPAPMDQENEPPDCVARNLDDLSACSGTPAEWIGEDPLAEAAAASGSPGVSLIGVNQYLCSETECPAVIGGVIVFSDFNHLTTTFSKTLAPYLEPGLSAALR